MQTMTDTNLLESIISQKSRKFKNSKSAPITRPLIFERNFGKRQFITLVQKRAFFEHDPINMNWFQKYLNLI